MMIKTVIFLVVLLLDVAAASADNNDTTAIDAPALPIGVIDPQLLAVGYSGNEKLVYDVSWSGGLKIGELHLEVNVLPEVEDGYEIRAFVTTKNGALNLIYPIEDLHVTKVRGPNRLPYHYEIWQKEGYNYRAHRVFEYDQNSGYIRYLKNEKVQGEYRISGETNNEFSSFFNSRLMAFDIGSQFVVPTFADKRKVDVVVHAVARKKFEDTIIGPVSTVEIMPVLIFEGLYEKKGDTVIWYTDDECRIPVRINSKISIGSLTAKLTEYENSACRLYSAVKK
jgi:hypothetical protein